MEKIKAGLLVRNESEVYYKEGKVILNLLEGDSFLSKYIMNEHTGHLFSTIERLLDYKIEKIFFKRKHGYDLNLKNPRSYNEKVMWKKLNDRNPLLPIVSDKYRVRDYLRKVLGKEEADKLLIPLLYVTDKPETIPFDNLPEEYAIKANHGSGWNIFVEKQSSINRKEIIRKCKNWLKMRYGVFGSEWAYQEINRKILVEKLLRDENGKLPIDIKFHMIHGDCIFIQIDFDRHTNHRRSLFDKNWNFINASHAHPIGPIIEKPSNFDRMLALSKKISAPFDCIRVDFYSIRDKLYIGELTSYHGGGANNFTPISADFELGKSWKLDKNYWKKVS